MFLVLGLGNPGRKYASTRHNVGFLVVERLAERWNTSVDKKHFGALVGNALIGRTPATLAMPQSYMNLSGQPAASLRGFYKLDNDKIVVVHDDLDIPFGDVRVKTGGGHGGHNGLRDLNKCLGNDYHRVRVGVSRPPEGWDTADYVLGKWSTEESQALADVVDDAADAVEAVLADGALAAMNHFNQRGRAAARRS